VGLHPGKQTPPDSPPGAAPSHTDVSGRAAALPAAPDPAAAARIADLERQLIQTRAELLVEC